ncbi:nucleotidyltransferase domain-containing protein [Hydrogenophaga sp.]|uniref:nucleotidyltransferase domain-containing protein n=1 Tax=Hydrogenophaga sp. TaxID=1904254 RepID=UPI003D14F455
MQRDNFPVPVRRPHSPRAARQFNDLTRLIAGVFLPSATQVEALDRSYESIGNFLTDSPEFGDLVIQVYGQGSRQIGTLVRPLHLREQGFDVDAVLLLQRRAHGVYPGVSGARQLINNLHTVLSRYARAHGLKIERWDRCVTLVYSDGVRVDVAPVIEDPIVSIPVGGETHSRIPDRQLMTFVPTNPRGIVRGFNEAASVKAVLTHIIREAHTADAALRSEVVPLPDVQEVSLRLLCSFVQLMKVHRNISFGASPAGQEDLSPSSLFITTLMAQAYAQLAPVPHDTELDLLLDIIDAMVRGFRREILGNGLERWLLPNPWAPGDDLASSMDSPQKQQAFLAWHARFQQEIGELLDSLEARVGGDNIKRLVESAFGSRAAQAVRDASAPTAVTQQAGRRILVGTATGGLASMSANANTNFGSPQ